MRQAVPEFRKLLVQSLAELTAIVSYSVVSEPLGEWRKRIVTQPADDGLLQPSHQVFEAPCEIRRRLTRYQTLDLGGQSI